MSLQQSLKTGVRWRLASLSSKTPLPTGGSRPPASRPSTVTVPNQQVINQLTENDIIQRPVFEKFGKTEQMHKLQPMRIADKSEAEKLRAYFLAHSVPATSFAAGANKLEDTTSCAYQDYESAEWPRWEGNWFHSDLKDVAYYFNSRFFKKIVKDDL